MDSPSWLRRPRLARNPVALVQQAPEAERTAHRPRGLEAQLEALAATNPREAGILCSLRGQVSRLGHGSTSWEAADAAWTIIQSVWQPDDADAFFTARTNVEADVATMNPDVRAAAEAVSAR